VILVINSIIIITIIMEQYRMLYQSWSLYYDDTYTQLLSVVNAKVHATATVKAANTNASIAAKAKAANANTNAIVANVNANANANVANANANYNSTKTIVHVANTNANANTNGLLMAHTTMACSWHIHGTLIIA
jgi:hypothetical protein